MASPRYKNVYRLGDNRNSVFLIRVERMEATVKSSHEMLAEAAAHLQSALDLLDRAGAPAQIGAHVDLAAHELHDELRRAMAAAPQSRDCSGRALQ